MASAPVHNKIHIIQGHQQHDIVFIPKPSKYCGFAFAPPDGHVDLFLIINKDDDIYEHIYNIDRIPILKEYNKHTKVAECHLYLRPSDQKGDFYIEVYDNPVIIHDVNWFNEMPVSVLNEYVTSFNKFFTNIYNIKIV